jgi:hypothetical protein
MMKPFGRPSKEDAQKTDRRKDGSERVRRQREIEAERRKRQTLASDLRLCGL